VQRGEVYRFKVPKGLGHEQQGERYGLVVQSDALLPRSVVVIAPTSRSARPASFRPEVEVSGGATRVLVEQLGAVDVQRLGRRGRKMSTFLGQVLHRFIESGSSSCGLLIHAALGSSSGVGGLRTNRSGCAA
jgi:mRNA interferase MazF